MRKLWIAFMRGISSTLGVAQVRWYIPTPAEEMEAVAAEVRDATASVDAETGRFTCCGTDALSAEPFHAAGCPNCGAVELPRAHRLAPRSWQMPDGTIIADADNREAVELLKSDPDEFFRITKGILHKPITMRAVCSCIVELMPNTVELSWETEYTVVIIAPCLVHLLVFKPIWWSRLLDKLTATNDLCYHVVTPSYGGRGVERVELGCSHSTSHHTNRVRGCSRCGCDREFK